MFPSDGYSYFAVFGALAIFFIVSAGAAVLLWIALPFSVFGIKGLFKKTIEGQERTNALLSAVLAELERLSAVLQRESESGKKDDTDTTAQD
ncbi:MAG: hypothetical protein HY887_00605 [Deltaproteobacteria bacterium]|nr:hypothetical protein [Deltaproteobacteria bacterium]